AWGLLLEQVVENGRLKWASTALVAPLPGRPELSVDETTREEALDLLATRVKARSQELVSAVMGTPEIIQQRVERCQSAVGELTCDYALAAAIDLRPTKPDYPVIDRGAAFVLSSPSESALPLVRLRGAARARLWDESPTGGAWAVVGGCGVHYLDYPNQSVGMSCGMGSVPEGSRRFLLYFVPWTPPEDEKFWKPTDAPHPGKPVPRGF
ncbi:MAG: hypothetical protein KDB61_15845, partial [Planctomycetes bacterium]|nr:hypothetical protein [Planctomycetota bacterium]